MGILKFAIVGVLIMLPFYFISYSKEQTAYHHEQLMDYVEDSIDQAASDASFALKTFSEGAYDGDVAYRILIPYDTVVDTFFDSLTFLEFPYVKSEFLFLVFVEYDGIVLYVPRSDCFLPKQYFEQEIADTITYCKLDGSGVKLTPSAGTIEKILLSDNSKNVIVLESLQKALNTGLKSCYPELELTFDLPMYDQSDQLQAINDVSFIGIYQRAASDFLGSMTCYAIKPSGIMKIKASVE